MIEKKNSGFILIFLLILTIGELSTFINAGNCFENTPFPQVFGGTGGDTEFLVFDEDSSGNVVAAGYSSDPGVVSPTSLPNPVVLFIKEGGAFLWKASFSTIFQEVVAIKFSVGGSNIILALDSSGSVPYTLIYLSSTDGSVQKSYEHQDDNIGTFYPQSLVMDDNNRVYAALKSESNRWQIMKFTPSSASQASWQRQEGQSTSAAYALTIRSDNYEYIYAVGSIKTSNLYYAFFSSIQEDGDSLQHYGFLQGATSYTYLFKRIFLTSDHHKLWACGENGSGLMFMASEVDDSGDFDTSFNRQLTLDVGCTQCLGLYAPDDKKTYALVYGTNRFAFINLDSDDSSRKVNFLSLSPELMLSSNNAYYFAQISSTSDYKFCGGIKQIATTSYSYKVGIVASSTTSLYSISSSEDTSTYKFTTAVNAFAIVNPGSTGNSADDFDNAGISTTYAINYIDPLIYNEFFSITATTLTAQTYYIYATAGTYTFADFTINKTCSDTAWTYTTLYQNFTSLPSFITFTSSTRTFSWSTSNQANVGTYDIVVTGMLINGQTQNATFTLTVINPCLTATLTASTVSASTYTVSQSSSSRVLTAFTSSNTNCAVEYTLTYDGGAAITTPPFTFIASSRNLAVYTTDNNYATTHSLILTAKYTYGTTGYSVSSAAFIVTISSSCTTATLTKGTMTDKTYIIGSGATTYTVPAWTSTISGCGTITYTATFVNGTSLPSIITNTENVFVTDSSTLTDAKTYPIRVTGTLSTYGITNTQDFNIILTSPCTTASITVASQSTQTYYITQPSATYSAPTFSSSVTAICGALTYSVTDNSLATLNSIFTVSAATPPTVSVYTIDSTKTSLSPQTVKYTACYTNAASICKTSTYSIQIQTSCTYNSITPPVTSLSITYTVNDPALITTIGNFATLASGCGSFTYSCYDTTTTAACSTSKFTVIPPGTTPQFSTVSVSAGDVGSYELQYKATMGSFVGYVTLYITIQPANCAATVISSVDVTPSPFTYNVTLESGTSQPIQTLSWTQTLTSCAAISYALIDTDTGLTADTSLFNVDASNRIVVASSDYSQAGKTYNLKVIGSVGSITAEELFDVTFTGCIVTSVNPDSTYTSNTMTSQEYKVRDSNKTIAVNSFVQVPSCGRSVSYSLAVDALASLPVFITYDDVNSPLSIDVYSNTNDYAGTYSLYLTATVTNYDATTVSTILTIPLVITPANSAAPAFSTTPLAAMTVTTGTSTPYSLPSIIDVDGDSYTVTVDTGSASFVTWSYPTLTIEPVDGDNNGSPYTITITLTDTNVIPLSYTFTLTLTVKAEATTTAAPVTTAAATTAAPFKVTSPAVTDPPGVQMTDQVADSLKAVIRSVTSKGVATVVFSSEIITPSNYTNFNNSVHLVEVTNSGYKPVKDINFTWSTTNFQAKYFTLQLLFDDPTIVSKNSKNYLSITFLSNSFFVEKSTGMAIAYRYKINKAIPKQLRKDAASAALAKNGASVASTLNSLMYGTLALNLVMYNFFIFNFFRAASFQLLWGMLNVIQLIINMPLLNVAFPSNALMFYSLITDMAQMNLLPSEDINKDVLALEVEEENANQVPDNFQMMGYKSMNIISNLKSMFMYLIVLVLIIAFTFLMKFLAKKYSKVNTVYKMIADRLFFNIIFRALLEGYMQFCVNSMLNLYDVIFLFAIILLLDEMEHFNKQIQCTSWNRSFLYKYELSFIYIDIFAMEFFKIEN